MKMFIEFGILILCLKPAESGSLRYCIPKMEITKSYGLNSTCFKLYKAQHEIQCVTAVDRLACLKLLSTGKADFMVAEPEDLRVISATNETNIQVTHELKKFAESLPQLNVEMIAIVKGESNTKGKKLCYLGLESGPATQFDYYYRHYFESWLFSTSCDPEITVLENRVRSLSKHFNSACIAGPWSLDPSTDAKLKSKYKNLCALCSNPYACSEQDRYFGMSGALNCLRQGVGNVGWFSRSEASKYFSQLASSGYSLLCPDGNLASLVGSEANSTCTWVADPRPVIIAHKSAAEIVRDRVTDKGAEGYKFYQVIHTSYKFSYLRKLSQSRGVRGYIAERYFGASVKSGSACRTSRGVRWCVSSASEARKCRTMQAAAEALAIGPGFSCVSVESRSECVRAVSAGKCDVFVAQPGEGRLERKSRVKSIIELMAHKREESNSVAAIVRKKSRFKSFADLKGGKACFTGYRSVGWNAFFSKLKTLLPNYNCKDAEAISAFFKESCVLGTGKKSRLPKNLYSTCKNNDLKLDSEEKTFKCLMDGADVAFVNVSAAKAYSRRFAVFNQNYRVLCPTRKDEEDSCYLAKVTLGHVLVHEKISKVKEDDIYLMFLALNRYFGRTFDRETPMFEMYQSYEGESNVIFSNATMKLERTDPDMDYGVSTGNIESDRECRILRSSAADLQTETLIFFSLFTVIHCVHIMYIEYFL